MKSVNFFSSDPSFSFMVNVGHYEFSFSKKSNVISNLKGEISNSKSV